MSLRCESRIHDRSRDRDIKQYDTLFGTCFGLECSKKIHMPFLSGRTWDDFFDTFYIKFDFRPRDAAAKDRETLPRKIERRCSESLQKIFRSDARLRLSYGSSPNIYCELLRERFPTSFTRVKKFTYSSTGRSWPVGPHTSSVSLDGKLIASSIFILLRIIYIRFVICYSLIRNDKIDFNTK